MAYYIASLIECHMACRSLKKIQYLRRSTVSQSRIFKTILYADVVFYVPMKLRRIVLNNQQNLLLSALCALRIFMEVSESNFSIVIEDTKYIFTTSVAIDITDDRILKSRK